MKICVLFDDSTLREWEVIKDPGLPAVSVTENRLIRFAVTSEYDDSRQYVNINLDKVKLYWTEQ